MKTLVVHTPNKGTYTTELGEICRQVNKRFNNYYYGDEDNYNRLTIVGVPNEIDKTLNIGVSFCAYPNNFNRYLGTHYATLRAEEYMNKYKPYSVVHVEDFTMKNCLKVMYNLHSELINKSIKEVKRLVATQIVK